MSGANLHFINAFFWELNVPGAKISPPVFLAYISQILPVLHVHQKSPHQVNTDPMISMTGHLDVVVPPTIIDEESRSFILIELLIDSLIDKVTD